MSISRNTLGFEDERKDKVSFVDLQTPVDLVIENPMYVPKAVLPVR